MIKHSGRTLLRMLAGLGLALHGVIAGATFHLYQIDQIYSDASGNVQYIRLATSAPLQQFLNGVQLQATQGTSSHIYTFPNNLPGDTTSTKFLIATQGFANLNIVTPDYIVPNGFLFLPGGTLTYGPSSSVVSYPPLPTDGTHAVDALGNPVTAAPTNFAGQTGSVNVPPPTPAGPFDVDGNGTVDALTDGLMLLRYQFGLRGASLIQGALGQGAARNTSTLIENYIASQIP
jgi:hypothetical protein